MHSIVQNKCVCTRQHQNYREAQKRARIHNVQNHKRGAILPPSIHQSSIVPVRRDERHNSYDGVVRTSNNSSFRSASSPDCSKKSASVASHATFCGCVFRSSSIDSPPSPPRPRPRPRPPPKLKKVRSRRRS